MSEAWIAIIPSIVTLVLFWALYKEHKRVKMAEAILKEAEAGTEDAKAGVLTVQALGDAIRLLQNENKRLSEKILIVETSLRTLQSDFQGLVRDNENLRRRVAQMRDVIVELLKGIERLIVQLRHADPAVQPDFKVPNLADLLDKA